MRKIIKLIQIILPLLFLATACQEDIVTYNDGYNDNSIPTGKPVIEKIIMANDTASFPTEISGAPMAKMIAICGTNLGSITAIRFNDVEADLKTIYAVNSRITMPVPRMFPTTIDNKLTVTTTLGNVTADFTVSIPSLVVNGLENEFMAAGDTVKLLGEFFDLYDITEELGEVKVNETPVEITEAAADYITFQVPPGTPDGATITVNSPTVVAQGYEPFKCAFREWGNPLINFDSNWGSDKTITDGTQAGDPVPPAGITKFFRIKTSQIAWAWFTLYGGGYDLINQDIVDHPENYCVKFEILTKKQISIGNLLFEHPNAGRGDSGRFSWDPADGGIALNTNGKWKTYTFNNVSDFFATENPEKWHTGWMEFSFIYQPKEAVSPDFCMANFRIAKKYNQ
jgi:hypothetical protein